MVEKRVLDVEGFSKRKTGLTYPYFRLLEISELTPYTIPLLEAGDIPILWENQDRTAVLGRISLSALNVRTILHTHAGLLFCREPENEITIKSPKDYLDALVG